MANPTLLSRLLCADADKNTIPDTDAGTAGVFSQQYGWQAINSLPLSAGGKAVQRQDFNGVFNLLGGIAFYAQKGYTFEWDIDQDYYANCVVTDPLDGNKYNAKNDVAKGGSNPSLDSTNWELFGKADGFDIGDLKVISHNNTISSGWLLCDGSAVSRTTYAELFAVIGTTYGVGDGTTTFNLPNYIDNFAQGSATAGTVKGAGLPNIIGDFRLRPNALANNATPDHAFEIVTKPTDGTSIMIQSSTGTTETITFDASKGEMHGRVQRNDVYGMSETVQPPALTCRVLIKYE